ncbi:Uncharacterised protein [Mycobacteroides abscessus subsp. massiliense]|nr:Uncharacterised protein [Mycobacteroides abscessus subsp. massiliense]SKS96869.1 Uncharacterised protein [Mycobacteroides abscessus subsp. abscessus]
MAHSRRDKFATAYIGDLAPSRDGDRAPIPRPAPDHGAILPKSPKKPQGIGSTTPSRDRPLTPIVEKRYLACRINAISLTLQPSLFGVACSPHSVTTSASAANITLTHSGPR